VKFSKEVKVGAFMVISIATLYLGFNYLKGIDFLSGSGVYYVVYDDVLGLQVSNSVSVNGFSVGRVSNISLMQERGNKVLVELDVQQDIELNDSSVAFLDVGLLGGVSIILEVGESETKIQPGDTLQARLDKALVDLLKESALPVADNTSEAVPHGGQPPLAWKVFLAIPHGR
jgi:phospholipid/cholesterol/gamma-HCH transport system substrate-binding protein